MPAFTIIDAGRATEVGALVDGKEVRVPAEAVPEALGWELTPRGLCRGDVCVPVTGRPGLVADGAVHLVALADLLGRPLALDVDECAAYFGASAAGQQRAVHSLQAPDFTLPDLDGHPHSLSAYRGAKVLLVAWASW